MIPQKEEKKEKGKKRSGRGRSEMPECFPKMAINSPVTWNWV